MCALKEYGPSGVEKFHDINDVSYASLADIFCYYDEIERYNTGYKKLVCSDSTRTVFNLVTSALSYMFSKNSVVGSSYSSAYMPMMLDENYIMYQFGNDNAYTSYPLFNLKYNTTLKLVEYSWTNVIDGSKVFFTWTPRLYNGVEDNTESNRPYYSTVAIDTNIPFYDIIVDSDSKWVIENHSRLVAAGLQLGTQAVKTIASGVAGAFAGGSTRSMSSFTGVGSRDLRYGSRTGSFSYWSLPLKKSVRDAMSAEAGRIGSTSGDVGGPVSNFMELARNGLIMNSQIVQGGMQPNDVKQTGNYSDKLNGMSYLTWRKILKVNDYEQVARYYHRYAYLVNEYVGRLQADVLSIFDYVQNRYYFNILKMKEVNTHLIDVIEDENTCELITDRLVNGIRLWNIAPQGQNTDRFDIGTYQYDNVENDYL